ncbi:hypothetical protein RJ640_010074 [Escallonia rubra]|uniref:Leucine-rich repeat-containing N-terminal plant-type domain-containing protein n=1 Tax=Escallonia rubra TaxID=112253 RepID=A0AA88RKR5_9ASTE|nr:hypothetical protein RJ640_010074 [Escallonia rubra]
MKTSPLSIFALSLFLCLSLPSPCISTRCNANDREVLLQIKQSLNNPTHLAAWKPNTDCCDWNDVMCDTTTNRITTLQFGSANISGQFPAAVGDLPYLESLVLENLTSLTGYIPSTLAKLSHLRYFSVTKNSLSGPIPPVLSKLKNLLYINLSFNRLSGPIPSSLSQLTKLSQMYLDHNRLTGRIPDSFGTFTVPDLDLSHNLLSGPLPKSMGKMNYTTLDFSHNMLEGDVSVLFGKNKTVQEVFLSNNKLSFDISKVEFPANVTSLDLSHNRITGTLPASLASLQYLFQLNVSYNGLCGQIPTGGRLQRFQSSAYLPNRCLCGAPLPACK